MRLLGLNGSLRAQSSNLWVLRAVAELLPRDVSFEISSLIATLPHFNPDLEAESPPETVAQWRSSVAQADGLVISCPEYAHGLPGSFKNALDWLVSDIHFPGMPVLVVNASPHSHHAQDALAEILRTMSARLVQPPYLTLPFRGRPNSSEFVLGDAQVSQLLEHGLEELIQKAQESRMEGS